MNFCPYCGKSLQNDMLFCPACGKAIPTETETGTLTQLSPEQPAPKRKKKSRFIKPLIAVLGVIVFAVVALLMNPFSSSNFSEDPKAIEKASKSVVKLYMYDANGILEATGSGFAAFDNDIIITNHHCITGNVYSIEAQRADGSTFPIDSIVAYDETLDIAILRAPDSKLKPLKTAIGLDTKQGEKVAAIGSPTGISGMYSTGVLSKIENNSSYSVLLSTASISSGSSGGALFNNRGEVIGITSAGSTYGNEIYYSIPIEYAQSLYDNRTAGDELTVSEWYEQSEHAYTVDYVMANGSALHKKPIAVYGYISGLEHSNIYLVSSLDLVAYIDNRGAFDLVASMMLSDLHSSSYAAAIDVVKNGLGSGGLNAGDFIVVEGLVMHYDTNDTRIIATKIYRE